MKNSTMNTLSVVNKNTKGVYFKDMKFHFDSGILCDDPTGLVIDLPGHLCVHGPITSNYDIEIRCNGLDAQSVRTNGHLTACCNVSAETIHAEHGIFATKELKAPKYIYTAHGNITAGAIWTDGELQGGEIRANGIDGKNQGNICADNIHADYGVRANGEICTRNNVIANGDIIMDYCQIHGFIRTQGAVVIHRGGTITCREINAVRGCVCCNI